jgi:N-acetylneuraminate synthase
MPDDCMAVLTAAYIYGAQVIEKHFTLDKTLSGNDHYHAGDPKDFAKAIQNFGLVLLSSGSGEKTVLGCEEIPRREARRSLVLTRDIKSGEKLKAEDIMVKRPGTGIPPMFLNTVIGRAATQDLPEDTVLTWSMI